jgi:hypothetical protein
MTKETQANCTTSCNFIRSFKVVTQSQYQQWHCCFILWWSMVLASYHDKKIGYADCWFSSVSCSHRNAAWNKASTSSSHSFFDLSFTNHPVIWHDRTSSILIVYKQITMSELIIHLYCTMTPITFFSVCQAVSQKRWFALLGPSFLLPYCPHGTNCFALDGCS